MCSNRPLGHSRIFRIPRDTMSFTFASVAVLESRVFPSGETVAYWVFVILLFFLCVNSTVRLSITFMLRIPRQGWSLPLL